MKNPVVVVVVVFRGGAPTRGKRFLIGFWVGGQPCRDFRLAFAEKHCKSARGVHFPQIARS